MRTPSAEIQGAKARAIPAELVNILGTGGALLAVVTSGAAISSVLPDPASPWLFAAAYGGPGAVAFAAYWWIAQRV
jgi:hypothetical protein